MKISKPLDWKADDIIFMKKINIKLHMSEFTKFVISIVTDFHTCALNIFCIHIGY